MATISDRLPRLTVNSGYMIRVTIPADESAQVLSPFAATRKPRRLMKGRSRKQTTSLPVPDLLVVDSRLDRTLIKI